MLVEIDDKFLEEFEAVRGEYDLKKFLNFALVIFSEEKMMDLEKELKMMGIGSLQVSIGTNYQAIPVIKEIRAILSCALRTAKELHDDMKNGKTIKLELQDGQDRAFIIEKLESFGCKVTNNLDPVTIVSVKNQYGELGARVLRKWINTNTK